MEGGKGIKGQQPDVKDAVKTIKPFEQIMREKRERERKQTETKSVSTKKQARLSEEHASPRNKGSPRVLITPSPARKTTITPSLSTSSLASDGTPHTQVPTLARPGKLATISNPSNLTLNITQSSGSKSDSGSELEVDDPPEYAATTSFSTSTNISTITNEVQNGIAVSTTTTSLSVLSGGTVADNSKRSKNTSCSSSTSGDTVPATVSALPSRAGSRKPSPKPPAFETSKPTLVRHRSKWSDDESDDETSSSSRSGNGNGKGKGKGKSTLQKAASFSVNDHEKSAFLSNKNNNNGNRITKSSTLDSSSVMMVDSSSGSSSPSTSDGEADGVNTPEGRRTVEPNINSERITPVPDDQGVDSHTLEGPQMEYEPEVYYPAVSGCRSVDDFEKLNRVEEGTYGVVYRVRDRDSGEVMALKKLKMEREKDGFPVTSLREINTLIKAKHENVVCVQEIVVGKSMDAIFIVMEFVEHDLKTLLETMKQPFLSAEVKTVMRQLLSGIHHLHDNWILHRDIKTSNILMSHKGILKIADFGLAREYGSPLKNYTQLVVTRWYRPPELLLGAQTYSTAVDMWSVGCIFAEVLTQKALFPGTSDINQIKIIFKLLGTPSEAIWKGFNDLPIVKKVNFQQFPYSELLKKFSFLTQNGYDLLESMLRYDPEKRARAIDSLSHKYFLESPKPCPPDMFPHWPAKSEGGGDKKGRKSPPIGDNDANGYNIEMEARGATYEGPSGFQLRF
eukprot:m.258965 g.258965  ORF g.258965 m.258965 type:complete len:735 (-) comp37392_c0_seq1:155-2359(-)